MQDQCKFPDSRDDILDAPSPFCEQGDQSLKDVPFITETPGMEGLGFAANCDPMLNSSLVDDMRKAPSRQHIYKHWKSLQAVNEAVTDLFRDISVLDVHGEAKPVPIIWGPVERAVAHIVNTNVRQDTSLVVNRIVLPYLAIFQSGITPDASRYIYHNAFDYHRDPKSQKPGLTVAEDRTKDTILGLARGIPINVDYTLTAWTLYMEDMDAIIEQILKKSYPVAYIRVHGVHNWETIVKLETIGNNLEKDIGDQKIRIIKFEFGLKAETFIAQPIVRKKSNLHTKVEMVDGFDPEDITQVFARIEEEAQQ